MTWSERFDRHLKKNAIKSQDVAFDLRVAPSLVRSWRLGATPRPKTQRRIERWSGGAVPAEPDARPSTPPPSKTAA